ncbi:MAG TPA: hypothetical protein VEB19_09135 [Gemmatimonadaceae bacterium]|nr:hypothetical protein [Gemmatimonadaceae bacterium]
MTAPPTLVSRSLAELAERAAQWPSERIRAERRDGTVVEGEVYSVAAGDLVIVDDANTTIQLDLSELRAIDMSVARRARELLLAGAMIVAGVAGSVAFAQLPWVRPERGDIVIGFMLMFAIVIGLVSRPFARQTFRAWFSRWHRVYSQDGSHIYAATE